MSNPEAYPTMDAQAFRQAIQRDTETAPTSQIAPDDLIELYANSWAIVVDHLERTTDWTSIYDPPARLDELVTTIFGVYDQDDSTQQAYNFAMFCKTAEDIVDGYLTDTLFGSYEQKQDYEDNRLLARIQELVAMIAADSTEVERLSLYALNYIAVLYYARLRGFFDPAKATATALYRIRSAIEGDRPVTWDQ